MADKLTAADIVAAVRRRYGCETDDLGPEWAALDEMDLQPGYSTRRIDLLLVRAWRSAPAGHERHAVEVKVSRADLRREVDDPHKWRAWHRHVHRFYLAVPADLNLDGIDLPDEWGLITVTAAGTRLARQAPRHDPDDLPEPVVVEVFRRAGRAESRIRQADDTDPAARIAALTRQLAAAERAAITARQAEHRWKERARYALEIVAHLDRPVTCQRCTAALRITRMTSWQGRSYAGWEHAGPAGECTYPYPDLDALALHLDTERDAGAAS